MHMYSPLGQAAVPVYITVASRTPRGWYWHMTANNTAMRSMSRHVVDKLVLGELWDTKRMHIG